MAFFFKRAFIPGEVGTRVAVPVAHPALQGAPLEPAMTDTQLSHAKIDGLYCQRLDNHHVFEVDPFESFWPR